MPESVRFITLFNPMRWFLEIMHGVVVKGVGLDVLWRPLLAQATLAMVFLSVAVIRFRKTLG
jgi:ABC-2 type transport system permease protein